MLDYVILGIQDILKSLKNELEMPRRHTWVTNDLVLYSQHLIFFVTYECAKKARVLHYTRLQRLATDKHSNLSVPFVSYDENKVL
jgi:hypothetical protein